jgi:large subunit ribosomal protein L35
MPWQFRMLAEGFVALTADQQQKHPHLGMTGSPDLLGAPFRKAPTGHRRSSKMPKMKTKSSAKKRFKITATGKVKAAAAGKRHGMIKRTNKFIRDARGTMVLAEPDGRKVVKNYLPNGL